MVKRLNIIIPIKDIPRKRARKQKELQKPDAWAFAKARKENGLSSFK
jgi:hypothetical protein